VIWLNINFYVRGNIDINQKN